MGNHIPQLGDRVRDLIGHANELARAHNGLTHAHRALVVQVRALEAILLRVGHRHAADGEIVKLTPEDLNAAVKEVIAALQAEAEAAKAAAEAEAPARVPSVFASLDESTLMQEPAESTDKEQPHAK